MNTNENDSDFGFFSNVILNKNYENRHILKFLVH